MRLFASALLLLAVLPPAFPKKVLTHETMWLMKRVSAPKVSPDGRWIVFTLLTPSYDRQQQSSDLWIVPADGSAPPRQLTATKGGEGGVAWSPDSKRLAFTAKREGDDAAQVYVLDLDLGGEARRVTSLSTGADTPIWRPDGQALLFSSRVYPGAADDEANRKAEAERKQRKYNARVYTAFPIRYWDRWLDERRPTLLVQTLEEGAKPKDLLAGSRLAEEAGFGGKLSSGGESLPAAWTPGGDAVVFAATVDRHRTAYAQARMNLYRAPATGGEPVALTNDDGAYDSPVFAPGGKTLYALFEPINSQVYNLTRLARFAWNGAQVSERRVLSQDLDRSVDAFCVAPDGREVYLLAEEAGHTKLFTVSAGHGGVRKAVDTALGIYTDLSMGGATLAGLWQSVSHPAEVVRLDLSAGRHTAVTAFNAAAAAEIDLPPLRHFWFTSRRGRRIHNMVALPPGFSEANKYPLFVLMHGGPANMWRDQFFLRWNYHLLASPGYVLLLTDYSGSTGYGEQFAQFIQGDPLAGPADEINEAADEAIRLFPFIDASRQAAGGASYGGHLANWMQATTTRYRCLISHAGLVNLESQWGTSDVIYHREMTSLGPVWEQGPVWREQNPARRAANFKTPMLVTIGEKDYRVPLNNSIENWSLLQRLRVPSKLVVFPEENHWIQDGENSRFFYQQVLDWLKTYL